MGPGVSLKLQVGHYGPKKAVYMILIYSLFVFFLVFLQFNFAFVSQMQHEFQQVQPSSMH